MKRFQGAMREQGMLMPYDLSDWLPEDHLARFIVDITDKLDFTTVYRQYRGKSWLTCRQGCKIRLHI